MVDGSQAVETILDPPAVGTTGSGKLAAVSTATAVAAVDAAMVGGGEAGGSSLSSSLASLAALVAAPGAIYGKSSPPRESEVHQAPNGPS